MKIRSSLIFYTILSVTVMAFIMCDDGMRTLSDCERKFVGDWKVQETKILTYNGNYFDSIYTEFMIELYPDVKGILYVGQSQHTLGWSCAVDTFKLNILYPNNVYNETFHIIEIGGSFDTINLISNLVVNYTVIDSNIIEILQLNQNTRWRLFK